MIARISLSILAVLALATNGFGADFVTVGFWNIEHLGKRTPGQRPIAIAEYIAASGVDVLGLCEIHDTVAGDERRNNTLDTAFAILNEEPDVEWKYELFPKRAPNDPKQLCGIAWNEKQVSRVGETYRIPLSDDDDDEFYLWDRHPHAAMFSTGNGRTDFVVIPVHMKSNVRPRDESRAMGRSGDEFGSEQRKLEAELLVGKLDDVRAHFGNEKDIIIIGDTNILDHREDAAKLIVNAGFSDLNSRDVASFVEGKAPFDRIFLSHQPEFSFARQRILVDSSPQEHEEYLSDHYQISTTFRTRSDDD